MREEEYKEKHSRKNQDLPESNFEVSSTTSKMNHEVLLMKVRELVKHHVACQTNLHSLVHKGVLILTQNAKDSSTF